MPYLIICNKAVTTINSVRNGVKEDIKVASEWFSLSNDKDLPFLSLPKVIKIGERCFSKFTNRSPNITILDECNIEIDGSHISSIVLTLINTLNNACKYGSGNDIGIITSSINDSGYKIEVTNSITMIKRKNLESGLLEELVKKLEALKSIELLRTQGGTGLYKSLHELRLSSDKFNLIPYIDHQKFIVEVSSDPENTNS